MKKFLSVLLLSFSIFALHAQNLNDIIFVSGEWVLSSGQLVPTDESGIDIEIREEIISIILEEYGYKVTTDFSFYNNGKSTTLGIAFPLFPFGDFGYGTISDFKCWTDHVETEFQSPMVSVIWEPKAEQVNYAFPQAIVFPEKAVTKTRISYWSTYGFEDPDYLLMNYLYGVKNKWKNSIGKVVIRIQNKTQLRTPQTIYLPNNVKVKKINSNTWQFVAQNVPIENDTESITIILGNIFQDDGPARMTKDRFFACNETITAKDLRWYTNDQLRLLRNAIYAFHGYPFESYDLIELFENKCATNDWWYTDPSLDEFGVPSPYPLNKNFSEDELSDIERNNINLIKSLENK